MVPKKVEQGVFGLSEALGNFVGETWKRIINPHDQAMSVAGIPTPEIFATSIESGGRSKFLPALAIAASAVSPNDINPAEVFAELRAILDERKRPLKRSDKPSSTKRTVKLLLEADPDCLEGVEIRDRTPGTASSTAALHEATIPTRSDISVLLMPFDRRIFNTTVELADLSEEAASTPLWGVPFGAYRPTQIEEASKITDMRLDDTMYNVAFPVPTELHVGDEAEGGRPIPIPALTVTDLFFRDEIVPGLKNEIYVVSSTES